MARPPLQARRYLVRQRRRLPPAGPQVCDLPPPANANWTSKCWNWRYLRKFLADQSLQLVDIDMMISSRRRTKLPRRPSSVSPTSSLTSASTASDVLFSAVTSTSSSPRISGSPPLWYERRNPAIESLPVPPRQTRVDDPEISRIDGTSSTNSSRSIGQALPPAPDGGGRL